jgi:Uma2 family endonuclease
MLQQYADRGIPEYWLIDPEAKTIIVLTLQLDQTYLEKSTFQSQTIIQSQQFPKLKLTTTQILRL